MGAEAPQWLFSSFVEAMHDIGATASEAELEGEARDLIARWCAPERHAHNTRHLINVLAHLDELSSTAHDPDVLRVAVWYHGAVLNRAVKADLDGCDPATTSGPCCTHAVDRLRALGVSEDVVARVRELIALMASHTSSRDDVDAQVVIDADLALLADSPQDYRKYRAALREEYDEIDDLTYKRARRRVVRKLLARGSVYQSPLAQAWEERARANLELELARLDDEIAELDPADTGCAEDVDLESGTVVTGPARAGEEPNSSTGTIIIKRRPLKKNTCEDTDAEPTSTGTLPVIAPEVVERSGEAGESRDSDVSSLENAVDALDVPSLPHGE